MKVQWDGEHTQVPVEQVTRDTDGTVPSIQRTVLREGGVQLQLHFSGVHIQVPEN
jgi:hypothetical protein